MITTTKAVVLRIVPYSDSKYILNCYSSDFGRISFVNFKPKGGKQKRTEYIHSLALVEVVFINHEKKQVHTARSVQLCEQLQSLLSNPAKQSIVMFLAEFLNFVIKDEDSNPYLYRYIEEFICQLNETSERFDWFHHKFLLELAGFTGFFPELNLENNTNSGFLNLFTGELDEDESAFSVPLNVTECLRALRNIAYDSLPNIKGTALLRSDVLDAIIRYYSLHFPDFKEPSSLKIFRGY